MSRGQGIFNRHEEIRLALRFFLASLHKHKQAGAVPDKQRVLHDFVRYKGLRPVVERLATPPLQPRTSAGGVAASAAPAGAAGARGGGPKGGGGSGSR